MNAFSEMGLFILDVVKMLVRAFSNINVESGVSFFTMMIVVSMLGVVISSLVVKFGVSKIHFDNKDWGLLWSLKRLFFYLVF